MEGKCRIGKRILTGLITLLCISCCGCGDEAQERAGKEVQSGAISDRESSDISEMQGTGAGQPAVSAVDKNDPDAAAEHIIVTYQTMPTSILEDMDKVLAAINELTVPLIGVEVEFRTVDAAEAFTEYPLWLSRGEQIDLMMLNYQDITTYISRGMLLPIDGLLEQHASYIQSVIEEGYYLTEGSMAGESCYGVAIVSESAGNGVGLWVPLRLLQETGMEYEVSHIYSLEELSGLFTRWKELYPESYPLGQITSGNAYSTYAYYGESWDGLGGDTISGVLKGDRIVNYYEMPEYYDFLCYLRKWYLAGYIYPDAAITDAPLQELVESGIVLSYPSSSAPGMGNAFTQEAVCLRTSRVNAGHQYAKTGFWTIPATSGDPEAAMRFLNLMYEDARVSNLIQWGLEGEHYEVVNEESMQITWPEGQNQFSVSYYNPLGLYGDRRKMYTMDTEEMVRARKEYNREAMETREEPRDFVYSTENVDRELAAAQKVMEKYVPVLESGSVDIDIYYPEFLAQLKMAGMEKILADKQEQYDRWINGKAQK